MRTAALGLVFPSSRAVMVAPSGDLVVGGSATRSAGVAGSMMVAAFRSNGTPRTTFGERGATLVDFGSGFDGAAGIVRQPDGRLVIAGTAVDSDATVPGRAALARLLANGRLDSTFGNGGRLMPARATSGSNDISDLVREPDGTLVAGGSAGRYASPGDKAADSRFLLLGLQDRH